MKEEEILSELFIDSLNISRNLIGESTVNVNVKV